MAQGFKTLLIQYKKQLIIGLSVFVCLVLIIRLLGSWYLEKEVNDRIENFYKLTNVKIEYDQLEIKGINGISVIGLRVLPAPGDTLLKIKSLSADLNLPRMLLFRPDVSNFAATDIDVRFVKRDSLCNYAFLFNQKQDTLKVELESTVNYSSRLSQLSDLIFRVIPANMNLRNLQISSENHGYVTKLNSKLISIDDHQVHAPITLIDSLRTQNWIAEGMLDKTERAFRGELTCAGDTAIIPYFDHIYNTKIAFKKILLDVKVEKKNDSEVIITGETAIEGLALNHWRLAPWDIVPGNLSMNYRCSITPDCLQLDSSSVVKVNNLTFHPFLKLKKEKAWHITASINEPSFPAENLFTSLPKGLFNSLDGVKVSGNLGYRFNFDLDLSKPDSLKFYSFMDKSSFKILNYGSLSKMNGAFTYTAYENDRPVRTFTLGTSNPNYRPLSMISPLLQNAVLQSEDGQFYWHNGFEPEALRAALVHDIKVKRFARGGSTISMQLVKNVFLNRNKNILRKLEEALVVWLIESNRITSKARMFEVYLNIVEWGPMVYGAEEGAQFYFNKSAADLTLNEAIYMASIVPYPKHYVWSFDENMQLKANRYNHFRFVANRLARSGVITEQEAEEFIPDVVLTGRAKDYFHRFDSIPASEEEIEAGLKIQILPEEDKATE